MTEPSPDDARRVSREVFGHQDLHIGQADAIEAVLAGHDVLLSSAETEAQRREALESAVRGDVEFLAVSPEQLANDEVLFYRPEDLALGRFLSGGIPPGARHGGGAGAGERPGGDPQAGGGEQASQVCGRCDTCESGTAQQTESADGIVERKGLLDSA